MSRLYKFVSGLGRVEQTEAETASQIKLEEKGEVDVNELSRKVDRVLEVLRSLKLLSSVFDNESAGDGNGNS